jgi:hypothetical protein
MAQPYLEQVFKLSGVPTYTFVKPNEYTKLLVSLRTPGRGLVVEGPSGIGKTTSVTKALEELGIQARRLSGRNLYDQEIIRSSVVEGTSGIVIIDDFHRLNDDIRQAVADRMKLLADLEDPESKIVVVGIARSGESLLKFARDLVYRIDTIRFEANPLSLVEELIHKGEQALNITIPFHKEVAKEAQGSFHLVQKLCHEACILSGITECVDDNAILDVGLDVVKEKVLEELEQSFLEIATKFARGPRLRREGRAPYLFLLRWLAISEEWSLKVDEAIVRYPNHKSSVGQVVDKGYLERFLSQNQDLSDVIHYDPQSRVLGVEDPKFIYLLRNLDWNKFARNAGFTSTEYTTNYDFALSFAGAQRDLAAMLAQKLTDEEVEVFYDKDDEYRIIAEDVEEYLKPIYCSGATYVIPILSKDYPNRIFTRLEAEQFKTRLNKGEVIPICYDDYEPSIYDPMRTKGWLRYDHNKDTQEQLDYIVKTLLSKLSDTRYKKS